MLFRSKVEAVADDEVLGQQIGVGNDNCLGHSCNHLENLRGGHCNNRDIVLHQHFESHSGSVFLDENNVWLENLDFLTDYLHEGFLLIDFGLEIG